MQANVHFNKLKLRNPFGIHHGNYTYRYHVIVEIVASGCRAFGETVAIDYYGLTPEHLESSTRKLIKEFHPQLINLSPTDFYAFLLERCPSEPFIRCAFDQAFVEIQALLRKQTITEFLDIPASTVKSSITIGLSDSDDLIDQRICEPWPLYKLKVNGQLPYALIERLNRKNKAWGIDANGSFEMGQAQKALKEVEELGGVYAEQLLKKGEWNEMKAGLATIPHLADESVTDLASAKRLLNQCDGFVLKLTKCGGITPTLELIKFAKSEGKTLLAGCMTESSIGINHMLQLGHYFDYFDLDGAFLISNDDEVAHRLKSNLKQLHNNGVFK